MTVMRTLRPHPPPWRRWIHAAAASLLLLSAGARADLVYVGVNGPGLHTLRLDARTGALAAAAPVADVPRVRWSVMHPRLPILYAAVDDGAPQGRVIAFAVDRDTGALSRLNEAATGGAGPTHLWLDAPSMTLLVANYSGGSASSIAIRADGSLGAVVSTVQAKGSGPHRRQASPHAHAVAVDPSGQFALVADMGADRVFVHGFDRATRALSADDPTRPRSFATAPGHGPRHFAFGADGRFVYLLNELTAELMVLRRDLPSGRLSLAQSVPTRSDSFQGADSGSEIALGRDGRFLYAANRSENTLLVYRVDAQSGDLSLVQRVACGGENPWTFALHRSGRWMLVANERSGQVNVFRIDEDTGVLSDTGQAAKLPAPISITLAD